MKIAKEFRWEMGHRLSFHDGKCINLHGHSYKALIEIEGDKDNNGMVLDYYELKKWVKPVIEELDHAFMVYEQDQQLVRILKEINSKHVIVDFESTAENISEYLLNRILQNKAEYNIRKVKVRVYETENTYAETEYVRFS
ncbi:MAG: 6-carboxytetrahydropterin synthase [Ignavibacteriales bacterium]|nr:6-carboxytetrahydropterin synthase [Ignavibacteriales bacterium]MCF8305584.1 6-carboxytetrahydropterin synthase [Ignavibacteriales bacterium]MCF8315306.1 6-carboxytetrahydropterin synthase [Ignavibacteriales bacterium]MCF8436802.1 6-carboxytetrahydropterin synthase [Ignavibacteriales bacterium]